MRLVKTLSPWVSRWPTRAQVEYRVFCFPFAGGSSSIYREWPSYLAGRAELFTIELPGRGMRAAEPLATDLDGLVDQLRRELEPFFDVPYVLFGHSMGALLAHELLLRTNFQRVRAPLCLAVSGRQAPDVRPYHMGTGSLSDEQFIAMLTELDARTQQLLADEGLRKFMLPVLRADFALCAKWHPKDSPALAFPILAFGGSEDPSVPLPNLERWRKHTSVHFERHVFPGGHFFLSEHGREICARIHEHVRNSVTRNEAPRTAQPAFAFR